MRCERCGIGEITSSLSMLAITIAILGGLSTVSMQSIRSAVEVVSDGSREAVRDAGVLLTVVATQENSTGSYVWIFNYGWESARISAVYLNGGIAEGWSSSCAPLPKKDLCLVQLPALSRGIVTILFGGKSVEVSL